MHLFLISDGPYSGTGFGEELRHLAFRWAQQGHEVTWLDLQKMGSPAIAYDTDFPDIPHKGSKIRRLGSWGNPRSFGSEVFVRHYEEYCPDMAILLGDPYLMRSYAKLKMDIGFPFIFYCTLDGLPIQPDWIPLLHVPNVLVTITEWARQEYRKFGLEPTTIHHGINWLWWQTTPENKLKVREKYGIDPETIVYISWDTNQHRKRLDALLRCWKAFRPETKNTKLILYTDWNCRLGWDIDEHLIKQYDVPRETILSPKDLTGHPKLWELAEPIEKIKEIAMLGDVYVSTTSGEGFGECLLQAQCFPSETIVYSPEAITETFKRVYSGDVFEICTENGFRLSGTPEHPVLTNMGWKTIKDICMTDIVYVGDISHGEMDGERIRNIDKRISNNDAEKTFAKTEKTHASRHTNKNTKTQTEKEIQGYTQNEKCENDRERNSIFGWANRRGRNSNIPENKKKGSEDMLLSNDSDCQHIKRLGILGKKQSKNTERIFGQTTTIRNIDVLHTQYKRRNILSILPKTRVVSGVQKTTYEDSIKMDRKQIGKINVSRLLELRNGTNTRDTMVESQKIEKIRVRQANNTKVYNLETENNIYFANNILVHNCLGMPVVATKYSAVPEVVGNAGVLVPCYRGRAGRFRWHDSCRSVEGGIVNERLFTKALNTMYDNKEYRTNLGKLGRVHSKMFDYDEVIVPQWQSLFSQINPDILMMKEVLKL